MANMSYCRFSNTLADLQEAYDNAHTFDDKSLTEEEREAFIELVKLCMRFAGDYAEDCKEKDA